MSKPETSTELEACQNRLGRNTVVLAGGEISARILGAVSAALIARTFGPEGFGQLTLALAVFFYFHLLATFWLDVVGTRRVASLTHAGSGTKQPVGGIIGLRLIAGAVSFGLLLVPALLLPGRTVGMLLAVYGVSCLVNGFLLDWYFIGTGRTGRVAWGRICKQVVFFAGVLVICIGSGELIWVPVAWVLADVAVALYLAAASRRDAGRLHVTFRWHEWKKLLRPGWPIAASALLVAVIHRAGTLILAMRWARAEVGFYGAAFFLAMAAVMLVQAFGQSLFPLMCRHFARGSFSELRRTLGAGLRFATTLILPLTVVGILAAPDVIELVYGPAYLPAARMFQVLMGAVFLVAVNTVFGRGLWAVGREKQYLAVVAVQGTATVLTAALLVGRWGGVGAACSLFAGELMGLAGYAWCLSKVVRVPVERAHLPAIAATALTAAAAWTALERLPLSIWVVGPAAAALYLGALALLGGVTLAQVRQIMPSWVGGHGGQTETRMARTETRENDGHGDEYGSRVA